MITSYFTYIQDIFFLISKYQNKNKMSIVTENILQLVVYDIYKGTKTTKSIRHFLIKTKYDRYILTFMTIKLVAAKTFVI